MKTVNFLKVVQVKESAARYDIGDGKVSSPDSAYSLIKKIFPELEDASEENLIMLSLNTKNVIVGAHHLSKGSLSASVVHPREVFKAALLNNASSFIIAHNHPSGVPDPSPQDIELTRTIAAAGDMMGIALLDHIIIGEGRFVSLNQEGLISNE